MSANTAEPPILWAADLPLYYNAVDILERNLPERAKKVALYTKDRELTFKQVSEETNRVGNALIKLGVGFGDVVGILALDAAEWVTSYFGTMKIGAIALGMNTLLTPHEYAHILRDSRAKVLIVHEKLLDPIEQVRNEVETLEHVVVIGEAKRSSDRNFTKWIKRESSKLETVPTHREDLATLNYSSGTTGEPKGVPHAHKDQPLCAQLWGVNTLGIQEDDRSFSIAKLFFAYGIGNSLTFPFYVGASTVLYPGPPAKVENVLELIDEFKPTILYNAPTGYAMMLSKEDLTENYDFSSLRLCVSAGESLPAPIWETWKERTGVDIIDGIGSTEALHIYISNRPDDIKPGSSGKLVEGYEVKIVDEDGAPVPQGEIGNLLVKGETLALYYVHQFTRSRQTFQGEWTFTGDKYSVDQDGYYWHAGRSDDMMKVGGIWVSPVEVESTLISHAAVVECAVVQQADSAGLIKPRAYVILKDGIPGTEELAEELIAYCREKMADYKRPRWIEFVDELPKTATGKIQRFKLRD
jgi:benzoate-CoA ligase family protein